MTKPTFIKRVRAPMTLRLINGSVAQGYNQAVSTVVQLLSVPVLLHAWGAEAYGTWITLSAIATYLTLADFGFGTIAGYEMGMAVGAGNRAIAVAVFQTVLAFITTTGLLALVGVSIFIVAVPLAGVLQLDNVSLATSHAVVLILSVHIIVSNLFNLICSGMRATGSFSLSIYLTGTSRLLEQVAVLIIASVSGGLVAASIGMLIIRIVFTFASSLIFWRLCPWVQFGFMSTNIATIRRLLLPSVTYMFYVLGNLLSIQGVSLIVAALFGPATVASFSAMRTLARLGPTSMNIINNALEPEYAFAFGAGQMERYRALLKWHGVLTGALCATFAAGALLFASWIFHIWTADKFPVVEPLMTLLIIAGVGEMIWSSAQTPLVSTSRHKLALSIYLLASAVSVVVMATAAKNYGVNAIGAVSVSVAFLMVAVTMFRLYRASQAESSKSHRSGAQ